MGQLENDIFDIYKDHKVGLRSLATTTPTIPQLRKEYSDILENIYRIIEEIDLPKKNKMKFARIFTGIAARGLVCLDQYEELEDGPFDISKFTRKELVCDMSTFKNTMKLLGFYMNWNVKK